MILMNFGRGDFRATNFRLRWFGRRVFFSAWICAAILLCARPGFAQVSPAEILNPDLKAVESKYFPQLKELHHQVLQMKLPFRFLLSRYVGIDPAKQAESDSRGLEFVRFHGRVVLKVTGNYNAAYNSEQLTQNQRASRTFEEVIAPVLRLVTGEIPPDVTCDAIGFEISYHTHAPAKNFDYEGKEILVVVFDRDDAFAFPRAGSDADRQEILNRSAIYLNGADYGLTLGARDAVNVETLARAVPQRTEVSSAAASTAVNRLAATNPNLLPRDANPLARGGAPGGTTGSAGVRTNPADPPAAAKPAATQADAEREQAQYQTQLDELALEGASKFHFVDYAHPEFVIFQNRLTLQVTLRNTLRFDAEKSSIYKRAAQSFDLFLAPMVKDILDKAPAEAEFEAIDFSVVNQLAAGPKGSSEAVEFICPRKALRQFADAEITNQQLLDQSVTLVNGVRVALTLQLVE
ncbi:MAG TPA: hypothetical protein VEU31_08560 [Candidatus Acidoferrales bacterium]|nr:hypothetical protein [Candidatus Acidoferrales bacterium]